MRAWFVDPVALARRPALIGILIPRAVVELYQASLASFTAGRSQATVIGDGMGA